MLPLSLVLLVFGWIFGLVSSLACSPNLLVGSASYVLFCSESTHIFYCCFISEPVAIKGVKAALKQMLSLIMSVCKMYSTIKSVWVAMLHTYRCLYVCVNYT